MKTCSRLTVGDGLSFDRGPRQCPSTRPRCPSTRLPCPGLIFGDNQSFDRGPRHRLSTHLIRYSVIVSEPGTLIITEYHPGHSKEHHRRPGVTAPGNEQLLEAGPGPK